MKKAKPLVIKITKSTIVQKIGEHIEDLGLKRISFEAREAWAERVMDLAEKEVEDLIEGLIMDSNPSPEEDEDWDDDE